MLPGPELEELAESIRTEGLLSPIVITEGGLILDGRNRAAACELAGVKPHFVIYDGDDPAAFVIGQNTTRRHMSTGALAMSTALVLQDAGRRKNGRWEYGKVQNFEQGRPWQVAMVKAGIVLDFKSDIAPAVASGDVALDAAFKEAKEIKDTQERNDAIIQELASTKYAALIENGSLTPAAAWAGHLEDTRKEREAQRQIESGIRSANVHMAEAVHFIAGLAPGDSFMRAFWPHHRDYVVEGMRITPERCRDAIARITRILKEFDRQ
jgi:hypothetical protein